MENKKIKNTKSKVFNGIQFKSILEVSIYKGLLQEGFKPKYEEMTFIIWEGFRPTVDFYNKDTKSKELKKDMGKLRDITYTPDFTFTYKDTLIIIEAKGFENDTFPIKKKLFRKLLEGYDFPTLYFEVYTKRHLTNAISIIKSL